MQTNFRILKNFKESDTTENINKLITAIFSLFEFCLLSDLVWLDWVVGGGRLAMVNVVCLLMVLARAVPVLTWNNNRV